MKSTCIKVKESVSWLKNVMLRRSPSNEHRAAWEAFERDRMRLATVATVVFTITFFIMGKGVEDQIDEKDPYIKDHVDMEQFEQHRRWIWPAIYFFTVLRIVLAVASYWRLGVARLQFACMIVVIMLIQTIPRNYGEV